MVGLQTTLPGWPAPCWDLMKADGQLGLIGKEDTRRSEGAQCQRNSARLGLRHPH